VYNADRDRRFIEHCRANPLVYGDANDQVIVRSQGLLREAEKTIASFDVLLTKIERLGLPPQYAERYFPPRGTWSD
jgi:hypothetical protein